ncbi:MAG TPA: shikimate kinase [Mycobacterium sp.]
MATNTLVFLIGPMGVGKTSIGRQLAKHLGWSFLDTDEEVRARTGADIGMIFEKEGEAGFRRREAEVLAAVIGREQLIVATGGGMVLAPANRELMRSSGYVVHLTSSLSSQLERTRKGKHRPALEAGDPVAALRGMREAREPLYRETANFTLQTDRRNPRAVATNLMNHLQSKGIA